jgi:hypothetical protein
LKSSEIPGSDRRDTEVKIDSGANDGRQFRCLRRKVEQKRRWKYIREKNINRKSRITIEEKRRNEPAGTRFYLVGRLNARQVKFF